MMDKLISQQAAIDKIKKRLYETAFNNVGIKQNVDETLADVAENRLENWFNELPTVQPERKGTRLSTVCLLCKKPAVTFNTEDDIPYTNYSYCEDCLRKGLKLLREQKKNLQTQPERKTGRWIPDNTDYYRTKFICSACGESEEVPTTGFGYGTMWDYCPMCGAKMEGGDT